MSGLSACTADSIALPIIAGLNFQSLQVSLVSGYSTTLPGLGHWIGHDALNITDLAICNVSLTYTHDGHTEPINTHVFLPLHDTWNGRMVGVGGDGWSAGLYEQSNQHMAGAVSEGYVSVSTDGGGNPWFPDPGNWLLYPNGTVNMYLLDAWANRAIGDTAPIGKAITTSFYGTPPTHSYWTGCSQGGRQGYMLAQRYPTAYNGILSVAPALNIPSFLISNYVPAFLMTHHSLYPHPCEFHALRAAAIAECDHLDGVPDNIISDPSTCLSHFNPLSLIGTVIPCPNTPSGTHTISRIAANVARSMWTGHKLHNGLPLWHPTTPDTDLVHPDFGQARTHCPDTDSKCTSADPSGLSTSFLTKLVRRNLNLSTLTPFGLEHLLHTARGQFDPILSSPSTSPNLTLFKAAGGKLLSWHGLSDEIIPPTGTQSYYQTVLSFDPDARSFYRYFDAPGVGHCFGGVGHSPTSSFADLVGWVERGKVPVTLLGKGPQGVDGSVATRPLCTWPLVARYQGTRDDRDAANFYCAGGYLSATPIGLALKRIGRRFGFKSRVKDEL